MTENTSFSSCGVPDWFGLPAPNETAVYTNEAIVAAVNIPFSAFAFVSNLAIIVTIIKTPSLQKPSNTLLSSLAATDCLTAITSQPIFVALRWHAFGDGNSTCENQDKLFTAFYATIMLTSGWSFAIVTVISFERHYALSRPFRYHTMVTIKGVLKVILITVLSWFLLTGLVLFVFSSVTGSIFSIASTFVFIAIPTVNNVRMFLAVRRQGNLVASASVSQELSVIFRREKKVALDMAIFSLLLLLSLAPVLFNNINQKSLPKLYNILQPWAITMVFLMSSINPWYFILRSKALRHGMKSFFFKS